MNNRTKLGAIATLGALMVFAAPYPDRHATDLDWTTRANAAGGAVEGPNSVAPDRYVYYPGTETLGEEEIRLFACGTGLPATRRDQAATCWLVELGNGDKFLFDVGTGSMVNVAALMIPYDFLNKVFLTHLHTDHWGDLATLWAGGWTAGRTVR
ncbi:MAG: MBL fold metallo-hydrolase [Hyphomicrobiales bacterium]|nr:MBL fold metallo-hydrolase [Hyphomicrobiales bacterium]